MNKNNKSRRATNWVSKNITLTRKNTEKMARQKTILGLLSTREIVPFIVRGNVNEWVNKNKYILQTTPHVLIYLNDESMYILLFGLKSLKPLDVEKTIFGPYPIEDYIIWGLPNRIHKKIYEAYTDYERVKAARNKANKNLHNVGVNARAEGHAPSQRVLESPNLKGEIVSYMPRGNKWRLANLTKNRNNKIKSVMNIQTAREKSLKNEDLYLLTKYLIEHKGIDLLFYPELGDKDYMIDDGSYILEVETAVPAGEYYDGDRILEVDGVSIDLSKAQKPFQYPPIFEGSAEAPFATAEKMFLGIGSVMNYYRDTFKEEHPPPSSSSSSSSSSNNNNNYYHSNSSSSSSLSEFNETPDMEVYGVWIDHGLHDDDKKFMEKYLIKKFGFSPDYFTALDERAKTTIANV